VVSELGPAATVFFWLGPVNILLGVFNLIPGFPLDGGRVLRAILWGISGDFRHATRWSAASGQVVAWLLIGVGFAMILGVRVPVLGSGPLAGLWIALIGWFLNNAAIASYQRVVLQTTLGDVLVTEVMLWNTVPVAPDLPVQTFVDELLLRTNQRAFPVIEEGRLQGLVCLEDVRRLDPEKRKVWHVNDIMTAVDRLHTVTPSQRVTNALQLLAEHKVNQVPVVDQGRFVGMVTREGVLKWLSLRGMKLHGESR
jgi:CBS domain-containing protein